MKLLTAILIACALSSCTATPLMAQSSNGVFVPDYERLASAIRLAEGNENYGILTHYKHTSYRKTCINTCHHAYLDWLKVARIEEKGHKQAYLAFLASRYAPRHVLNDPHDLNKNWLKNVSYWYDHNPGR